MGIFDDIFSDEDFEIKDEEVIDQPPPGEPEAWGTPPDSTWDTGKQQDLWNTDEPWTCDDDCGVCQDDCQPDSGDVIDDWF